MSVRQNFLFMARPWMIWGVLSLYKDFVTCFCEVSLCSCESKKTIRLTDPTRSLPCPLLPVYCPFPALYCPLLPFTCPILPSIHQNGQWVTRRTSGYRLGYRVRYRLPNHISPGKLWHTCRGSTDMSQQMIFVDRIAFGGVLPLSKEISRIRHSTVTLVLTTITEVLTDAHMT